MTNDYLWYARHRAGITLHEAAQAVNISASTLSRYEQGKIKQIPLDKLRKLIKFYRTLPGYQEDLPDSDQFLLAEKENHLFMEAWAPAEKVPKLIGYLNQFSVPTEEEVLKLFRQLDDRGRNLVYALMMIESRECKADRAKTPDF